MIPDGATMISPGVYSHGGEMHIDAVELCEANGFEPTEANQEMVVRAARKAIAKKGIPVEVREDG